MRRDVAAIVLAGGRSSRMGGGDKPLLRLNGRPLIEHVLERIDGHVANVAISANGDPALYAAFGLPVVADRTADLEGPLAGILSGLEWAGRIIGVRTLVTLPGDTPFLPRDLIERLCAAADAAPGAIVLSASNGRVHPVCGAWPLSAASALRAHMTEPGSRSVLRFVETLPHVSVGFAGPADGPDPFFNVNTPADLDAAGRLAGDVA